MEPLQKLVVTCRKCRRLHEIDRQPDDHSYTCDCGNAIRFSPPPSGILLPRTSDQPSTELLEMTSRSGWTGLSIRRTVLATVTAIIVAAMVISFWHGPPITWADLTGSELRTADLAGDSTAARQWLRILENNAAIDQHAEAAAALRRLNDPQTIAPLCSLAERGGLESRLFVIAVLGHIGGDEALPTLRRLFGSGDTAVVNMAITATTAINSPSAESVLLELLRDPVHGRNALPVIAAMRNDLAVKVLSQMIQRGPLAAPALREIGNFRLVGCTSSVLEMAADHTGDMAFRLLCLEALAQLDTLEARRGLVNLQDDSRIGWKARRLLHQNYNP